MGLRVDEPRAGGSGNSNDGNTARRAFRSPAEFAACTGVDQELIDRVGPVASELPKICTFEFESLWIGSARLGYAVGPAKYVSDVML
ncbi:hypothetical protein FJT64_002371 [Amphibalanus amphitrite]|uniref:Uncharacterized protein n=1 Tax=Amphibalanus amphitrite TaxID=1232801 RepID=A0A6A4WSS9_AMPAM|nr:hypothetical protein FJT64_002371 [Amphibalanus amphitrite]